MESIVNLITCCLAITLVIAFYRSIKRNNFRASVIQAVVGGISILVIRYLPDVNSAVFSIEPIVGSQFDIIADVLNSLIPLISGMMVTVIAIGTGHILFIVESAPNGNTLTSPDRQLPTNIKLEIEGDSEVKRDPCGQCGAIVYEGKLCRYCGQ